MPKISFEAYMQNPHILDCYLDIEKWKLQGGEDKDFKYIGAVELW